MANKAPVADHLLTTDLKAGARHADLMRQGFMKVSRREKPAPLDLQAWGARCAGATRAHFERVGF